MKITLSSLADESRKSPWLEIINRSFLGKWFVIGSLIGIVAGFGATIFYYMIDFVTTYLLGGITGFYPPVPAGEGISLISTNPHFYLIPISTAIGGLAAGVLVYLFAPEASGHGTDAAIDAFHNKGGVIRKRVPIVKTIASAFTIGSGGSAGREGPTAQIAAGFGSIMGDVFGLSTSDRRIAVAAGIGAGIGAIFKSPFGGAILSAEILYSGGDIEAEALVPGFIATPIGYVIFGSFTGFSPIFGTAINYQFVHPFNLVFYGILGILCAGFGRLYTSTFYSLKAAFDRVRIPKYVTPMIGGAAAGVIGIFFPEVLGLGYGFLQFAINGQFTSLFVNYVSLPVALILFLLIFLKIFATSLTVGSGGSGGVFAPALAIGGFLGALFWMVVQMIDPGAIPIPAPLVIVGMMALFAGVGRVPIAVILMVTEMTGNLSLLAPSMIAVVIAYLLTGTKYTIYRSQVPTKADSPAHRGEYNVPLMTKLYVRDAMVTDVSELTTEDTVDSAIQLILKGKIRSVPIVASSGKIVGIVTMADLNRIPSEKSKATKLKEVMTQNVITCDANDTLYDALRKMTTNQVGRLPIVDKSTGKLVGILTSADLFRAYERAISGTAVA
jgi:chloride channel protein, CIC family